MTKTKAQKLRAKRALKNRGQRPAKQTNRGRTAAPVAVSRPMTTNRPVVRNTPNGMTVTHRELVDTVLFDGAATFSVLKYAIQPGNAYSFPWLAAIANRFETYRFTRLSYEFVPMVASTTAGALGLCVDYDPVDAPPLGLQRFASYAGASFASVWSPATMRCSAEGLNKRPRYYVQTTGIIGGTDLKTYDTGNLYVGGSGTPHDQVLGQLWASYSVSLQTPQLNENYLIQSGTLNVPTPLVTALSSGFDRRDGDYPNDPHLARLPVISTAVDGIMKFARAWNGIMQVEATGTSLESLSASYAGTGTATPLDYILNAAAGSATKSNVTFSIDADAGDTILPWMYSSAGTPVLTAQGTYIRFAQAIQDALF